MGNKEGIETVSADELLASVQGNDQQKIDALKPGDEGYKEDINDGAVEGEKGEGEGEKGEGSSVNPDTNKGGKQLTEEEFTSVSEELKETLKSFVDGADEDTLAIKKEMLELFDKAVDFDAEGNLVDAEGKQVATYEDLVNKIGSQEEAIFDEAGNQIDKEGKVIATKHDLDIEESEVNAIGKELGYEFEENGKIKLYKEGTEGLKDLAEDIATYRAQELQENLFNSHPVLREVSKHLLAGGELEDFQKPIDYSQVDIAKMTLDSKKATIKNSYLAEGLSESRANKLVEGLEEGKELDEEVKESLNVLQDKQEAREQVREEALEAQEAQRQEDNKKYWTSVQDTITKGELEGFNIPEKDKQDFFRYLAIPVKGGQSQDQLDKAERTLGGELKEAFYRFKKYDVSDVINEGVSRTRVKSLRQRMKQKRELNHDSKPHIKGNAGEISLENIIRN